MTLACNLDAIATPTCPIQEPPNGHILTPWVRVTFESSGVEITVGNQSSPQNNNHAVIKDFELGFSNGIDCRITIIDEQGSSFVKFMEDLLKDFKCLKDPGNTNMVVEWGWSLSNCPSGDTFKKTIDPYHLMASSVEANFNNGRFLFIIQGCDITKRIITDHKEDLIYDKFTHLTQAIEKMLTGPPPSVASVKFQRFTEDGRSIEPITWKQGGVLGPTPGASGWAGNDQNRMATALRWLSDFVTDHDRGVTPMYNPNFPGGEIIFWEDRLPDCGQTKEWDIGCLGTYVVNGGSKSSVIEFNPKIEWDFASLSNAAGGTGDPKIIKSDGDDLCPTLQNPQYKGAGSSNTVSISNQAKDNHSNEAVKIVMNNQVKHNRANYIFAFRSNIEADLVIIGDPITFIPIYAIGRNVKIVVINPFYLFEGSNGPNSGCGEWLAAPVCNEVLTNKAWVIKSCGHRISEGKYTTTLKVMLMDPGISIDVGQPFGGPGSGGWTPPTNC